MYSEQNSGKKGDGNNKEIVYVLFCTTRKNQLQYVTICDEFYKRFFDV